MLTMWYVAISKKIIKFIFILLFLYGCEFFDKTPPNIRFILPANEETVGKKFLTQIEVLDINFEKLEFYVDNKLYYIYDDSKRINGIISDSIKIDSTGVHILKAIAFDKNNNSDSAIVNIYIPKIIYSYSQNYDAYALKISGNYAYVLFKDKCLRIFDVSNPSNPNEVGTYIPENTNFYFYNNCGVFISGNYLYICYLGGGLHIVNISNPSNPYKLSIYNPQGHFFHNVFVYNDIAYICSGDSGIRIVDVSNPLNPLEISHYDPSFTYISKVFIENNYAYPVLSISPYIFGYDFQIIDVRNPLKPNCISYLITGSINDLFYHNSRVYAITGFRFLSIINVFDRYNPYIEEVYKISETRNDLNKIVITANWAYIGTSKDIIILDIEDIENIKLKSNCETYGIVYDLEARDKYIFVACQYKGFVIIQTKF